MHIFFTYTAKKKIAYFWLTQYISICIGTVASRWTMHWWKFIIYQWHRRVLYNYINLHKLIGTLLIMSALFFFIVSKNRYYLIQSLSGIKVVHKYFLSVLLVQIESSHKSDFFSPKRYIFLHACTTYSKLPKSKLKLVNAGI